ncbi:ABC transporter permease [Clostridia bacterium OttesenSCG-928-O13]|nr:ABC transporter permease [Clostridia bacterium OttesenSCG-928-O13]
MVKNKEQNIFRRLVRSEVFGLLIALVAMILLFSLINPNYFTIRNLRTVLTGASLIGLICVGESLMLIGGVMDLSPGSTAAFSGVVAAMLLRSGVPFGVVLLITVFIGVLVGSFNAFFITTLKINAFIATLASQSIVRGFCYILSGGESILITNPSFLKMGTMNVLGFIPFPIFFMILIFVVFYIIMGRTRFGRNIYTVGGNAVAARLAGISTTATTYALFINMSVLAAVGGVILAARMNTGQPQACVGLEFDGITAAILGGVAMSGGVGSLGGAFVGLLILQGFNTGLTIANVQSFWQYVARGGLMLLALSFDYLRSQRRRKA